MKIQPFVYEMLSVEQFTRFGAIDDNVGVINRLHFTATNTSVFHERCSYYIFHLFFVELCLHHYGQCFQPFRRLYSLLIWFSIFSEPWQPAAAATAATTRPYGWRANEPDGV